MFLIIYYTSIKLKSIRRSRKQKQNRYNNVYYIILIGQQNTGLYNNIIIILYRYTQVITHFNRGIYESKLFFKQFKISPRIFRLYFLYNIFSTVLQIIRLIINTGTYILFIIIMLPEPNLTFCIIINHVVLITCILYTSFTIRIIITCI